MFNVKHTNLMVYTRKEGSLQLLYRLLPKNLEKTTLNVKYEKGNDKIKSRNQ